MTRPFEGIKIIDVTHVLAGPFAAYQLAVLGADVIKVEHPLECDQSRETGADRALNRRKMGTGFMTQGSNKRSITLDLKQERGREILKQLVKDADVMVENYRPGAFPELGIGYEDMKKINPRLIYCSMTAFGQDGPRGDQTAYDHAIQALSGVMAATGTPEVNPIKVGTPVIDYATGTMGAFAIASALFQREKTGKGQYIDSAMLDVALMMQASHITGYMYSGKAPKPTGNRHHQASSTCYDTKDGLLMLAASNRRQHKRLFETLGRPEMGDKDYEYREAHFETEAISDRRSPCAKIGTGMGGLSPSAPRAGRPRAAGGPGTRGPATRDAQDPPSPRTGPRRRQAGDRSDVRLQVRAWRPEHRNAAAAIRRAQRGNPSGAGLYEG